MLEEVLFGWQFYKPDRNLAGRSAAFMRLASDRLVHAEVDLRDDNDERYNKQGFRITVL
jgi:hypothetical protein